ncbi:MAG: PaaI family thioesterase [Chloroflexi bacterium]|nr:PaaI family thioesterase [Chloroflexota bacterium]
MRSTVFDSVPWAEVPIGKLLGMRLATAKPDHAQVELDVDRRFANPMGTLHGGVLCDLADAAMGTAFAGGLAEDESFTTLELKINFLRPVWDGRLRAQARVVQRGRTVGLVECDVLDEHERLIARASSTCLTLRAEQALGR